MNAAGTVCLPVGALLVGFLDNTEHASLAEAFAGRVLSAYLSTPPLVSPPNHLLLGILTFSQLYSFSVGGTGAGFTL